MTEPSTPFSSQTGLKMKAFSLSSSKKPLLSKKELEKQRKAEEDAAAAEAYQEFVETFEQPSAKAKVFVKGSVFKPGAGETEIESNRPTYYETSKMQDLEDKTRKTAAASFSAITSSSTEKPLSSAKKPKDKEKKKTNLELFKEELKMMQEQREERQKSKSSGPFVSGTSQTTVTPLVKDNNNSSHFPAITPSLKKEVTREGFPDSLKIQEECRPHTTGSFDTGDPNTTNLYLGNIHPKMTEQDLMEVFGKYGPLASVKVMWPRTEEERARNRNCGFVAFMSRKDGERALRRINGREIMGYEMKLGWGKAVPIPHHPVYVPEALIEVTKPPPSSGLPFNAQPAACDVEKLSSGMINAGNLNDPEIRGILSRAMIKVIIPTDRNILSLIHRMVEFVVNEGPMFEAMIMNKELQNPNFRFLFDNTSPAHLYYRWRLYSVLQGEQVNRWNVQDFQMFEGGSNWRPPVVNLWSQGVPDYVLNLSPERERPSERSGMKDKNKENNNKSNKEIKKGTLTENQREKLEDMLRNLTPERTKIADVMVYCIDHADAADEITECIMESLTILETSLHKKLGRFYLVSDLLHNCIVKVANASLFRMCFLSRLDSISKGLHDAFNAIEGRMKAEQFKQRVMNVFRVWEDWAIYSDQVLSGLQNIFLGLVSKEKEPVEADPNEDVDGIPLDEDVDGLPLEEEMEEMNKRDEEVELTESMTPVAAKFKPSKWETIDPDVVEAQAMTTSKWEQLEETSSSHQRQSIGQDDEDDVDGVPLTHHTPSSSIYSQDDSKTDLEKRALLREVEVFVVKFQDDLESGRRKRTPGLSLEEEVEKFRKNLIRQMDNRSLSPSLSSSSGGLSNRRDRRDSHGQSPGEEERGQRDHHHHESGRKRRRTRSRSRSMHSSSSGRRSRSRSRKREKSSPHSSSSDRHRHEKHEHHERSRDDRVRSRDSRHHHREPSSKDRNSSSSHSSSSRKSR